MLFYTGIWGDERGFVLERGWIGLEEWSGGLYRRSEGGMGGILIGYKVNWVIELMVFVYWVLESGLGILRFLSGLMDVC